jgi:predicted transcriptional regulator
MVTKPMGVRLSEDIIERLKIIGEKNDRSPHYLVKEAVEDFVLRTEADMAEVDIIKARVERYERTGISLSTEEMKDWSKTLRPKYDALNK